MAEIIRYFQAPVKFGVMKASDYQCVKTTEMLVIVLGLMLDPSRPFAKTKSIHVIIPLYRQNELSNG